ncbi:MAG: DUF4268 domain-containing protein [Spirochaetaceae bacterium]|nr:DUF4268 domain-containing protein [Spirochaetaceae bacterium]
MKIPCFGVVVELWKIDGSRPAPHFNLVAAPNDWRKESVSRATKRTTGSLSERGERYQAFFQRLIDTLREQHRFTTAKRAQAQNWYVFASGDRRFKYGANFTAQQQARVEVYIDSGDAHENHDLFDSMKKHKESIESELGYALDWQSLEDRRACRVATDRAGTIDESDDVLEEIHDWMVQRLLDFKKVFDSHLRKLTGRR